MDKIFNSKFVLRLQDFGQKLGSNVFLSSLQGGMMSSLGVLMVGAISTIIANVGVSLGLLTAGSSLYQIIYLPYEFTMNCISLWMVTCFAFTYAKNLKLKSPVLSSLNALICFLIVAAPIGKLAVAGADGIITMGGAALTMGYFGAPGMFVGFFVVFVTVRIEKICIDKNVYIKMPEVVPPFLQDGFSSILPLLFSVIAFQALSTAVLSGTSGAYNVCSGFMALLSAPLGALTSLPGIFIIGILAAVFWCFGIHGTMVISPILTPAIMMAASNNAAAYQTGGVEALVFYPVALFGCIGMVGGAGNTWPLALMGMFSKSKQIRSVSRISVIPGWFGVNEPMTFGMPIMYNPILCIPYILTVPVVMLLAYLGYQTGLILPSFIPVFSLLPLGFAGYFRTLHWGNFIFEYLLIIPIAIIWYPFFKIYERQLIVKEKAEAEKAKE